MRDSAVAIVRTAGKAMGLFERLAKQRPDLAWLIRDTKSMFGARNFVAHSVAQQDAISDGEAALFVLDPRTGESMITTRQARNNARLISEGVARCRAATARPASVELTPASNQRLRWSKLNKRDGR